MLELVASTLRLSTPLIFAAIGGFFCERSGVATICLEGVMLTSAWTAASVNYFTHNPWLALFVAMCAGSLTMALHAFLSITTRADQIISGVAINLFADGLTPLLNKYFFGSPTNSATIPLSDHLHRFAIPWLSSWGGVGTALFDQMPLVYLALLIPFAAHFIAYRTGLGLRLIGSGDAPEALAALGVSPLKVRYVALLVGGAITSFGGSYLSIAHSSEFTRGMTAGRGYIALAALIFGKWRPIPALLACLFFGFTDALQIQLQSTPVFGINFPVQVLQALPYIVTLFVLAGFVGGARPPLSVGRRLEV